MSSKNPYNPASILGKFWQSGYDNPDKNIASDIRAKKLGAEQRYLDDKDN